MTIPRALVTFALTSAAIPAYAQSSGDNFVFIGQTGDTNTISISQDGKNNIVGGQADGLPLGQNGRSNIISIQQTGSNNAVATNTRDGVRPSLGLVAVGTGQLGNRNETDIIQTTPFGGLAGTGVEAIEQQATAAFAASSAASNRLILRQTASGGGMQSVGQVIQKNTATTPSLDATNLVAITQDDKGTGGSNALVTAYQEGSGNIATVNQSQFGQSLSTIQQAGSGNDLRVDQERGGDNSALALEQIGLSNQLRLLQSGARNVVAKVLQNNSGVPISGNKVTLALAGDDNGGNGFGGLGAFSLIPNAWNVFQGLVSQIGDDNSVSYTTSAGAEKNLFGFVQDGDGNHAVGVVSGTDNELAIRQVGDDNSADLYQQGTANAIALDFTGERNRVAVRQSGEGNRALVSIAGNSNNNVSVTGFSGERLAASALAGLKSGDIRQAGELNSVDLFVSGDLNVFAVSQEDNENRIYGFMSGSANQAVVLQKGSGNVADFSQRGKGNGLLIRQ